MIAYFGYILFLIVAVFIDYQLFATESASQHKKAVHSIIYWLIITCLSVGFIYLSYEQDWFGGYQSHDTSSSTMNAISSFISGFLLEQSLSIDNIFVIAFLLKYFKVPVMYQNGLLSIGICRALANQQHILDGIHIRISINIFRN